LATVPSNLGAHEPASPAYDGPDAEHRELLSKPPTTALRDRIRPQTANRATPPQATRSGQALDEAPLSTGASTRTALAQPPRLESPASPAAPAPAAPNDTAANGGVDVERLVDLWPRICGDVKAVNRRIEALLREADPVIVTPDLVTIATAYDFHRTKLNADDVRPVIEDVMSRLVGRTLRVTCMLRSDIGPVASSSLVAAPPTAPESWPTSQPADTGASAIEGAGSDGGPVSAPFEPAPAAVPASGTMSDDDEKRIQAVKNIFDAEIIS